MIRPDRHTRAGLFLFALAFAGIAFYLHQGKAGYTSGYVVYGDYFSQLLNDEVSLGSLRAEAYSDDFRSVVGGRVEVTDIPESPYHVRISTIMASQDDLTEAHKRAISLLSKKLKELALTDVTSRLEYIDKIEKSNQELSKKLETTTKGGKTEPMARISEADSARAMLLQEKIRQLESFLAGGELSKTLRVQLDRETLRNAEVRVESADRELARLARVFQPDSKAVQAQRELRERARADLLSLEKELAQVYLRTLKIELEALDDKAASIAEQNSGLLADEPPVLEEKGESKSTEWLDARAEEFRKRAEEISTVSPLKLAGDLKVEKRQDPSRPIVVVCWLASLASFLGALFLPISESSDEEKAPAPTVSRQVKEQRPSIFRIELRDGLAETPDRSEEFFRKVCLEVARAIRREPRRILVIGDSNVEARLAFSIRLANNLAQGAKRVRLIDFDFDAKSLSERIGRDGLPGVSDLLSAGGPVDEFFSSIAGTRIQFAPAGTASLEQAVIRAERVDSVLGGAQDTLTIVDASASSPIHLLVSHIDAVLFSVLDDAPRTPDEQRALRCAREAGLPVWGVSPEKNQVFPLV